MRFGRRQREETEDRMSIWILPSLKPHGLYVANKENNEYVCVYFFLFASVLKKWEQERRANHTQ